MNYINKTKCIELEIRGKTETQIQEYLKLYYLGEAFLILAVPRNTKPIVDVYRKGTFDRLGTVYCDWLEECPY
jgi:hypothetical protein